MSKFSRPLKHKNAYHEKRHSLRVSFKGLNCAGDHIGSSIWIPINNISSSVYVHGYTCVYIHINNMHVISLSQIIAPLVRGTAASRLRVGAKHLANMHPQGPLRAVLQSFSTSLDKQECSCCILGLGPK